MVGKKIAKMKKKIGKDIDESKIIKRMNTTCIHIIINDFLTREDHLSGMEEHLWILGLDSQHIIFNIDTGCFGKVDLTDEIIAKVFRNCVKMEVESALIIHNYLTEKIEVTKFDKDIADKLYQCGKILGITVEDYMIMNNNNFISFKYSGVMEDIKMSLKNLPTYKLIDRLKEEEEDVKRRAFEEGKLEVRIEIAKKMRDMGMSLDTVMEITSLSARDIENILNNR